MAKIIKYIALILIGIFVYTENAFSKIDSLYNSNSKFRFCINSGGVLGRKAQFDLYADYMDKWFIGQTTILNDNKLNAMFGIAIEYRLNKRFDLGLGLRSAGFLNITQYDYVFESKSLAFSKHTGMKATLIDLPVYLNYYIPITSELRLISSMSTGLIHSFSRTLASYQNGFIISSDTLNIYKLDRAELLYQSRHKLIPFIGGGVYLEHQIRKHSFRLGIEGQFPLIPNFQFKQEVYNIDSRTGENWHYQQNLGWIRSSNFRFCASYVFGRNR